MQVFVSSRVQTRVKGLQVTARIYKRAVSKRALSRRKRRVQPCNLPVQDFKQCFCGSILFAPTPLTGLQERTG